jgi:hypothetical protein
MMAGKVCRAAVFLAVCLAVRAAAAIQDGESLHNVSCFVHSFFVFLDQDAAKQTLSLSHCHLHCQLYFDLLLCCHYAMELV